MINATDLRKGVIIALDNKLYQVVSFQHVKMKRTALVKTKLREVSAGHTTERTFQSDEKLVEAEIDLRHMQYLYSDGNLHYFMDTESFEQMPLTLSQLGDDALNYLREGDSVEVSVYQDEVIGVTLPITVNLKITETEPGFKGDTATAGTKPAKLETGLIVQIPLFVNQGDMIKVDTRTGTYIERSG